MNTQGHTAAYQGLRGHSVGEHYPYGITGRGNPFTRHFYWHIVHVPTGKTVLVGEIPQRYQVIQCAYRVLDDIVKYDYNPELYDPEV